ncbi:MAG: DUF433 domain-containing protein [Anaerolineae bacterium]|nr:DUF433 domain-containing protein [Anaerolineae bacterium]
MATIHPIDTIISDPQLRNGQPIIAGTSIRVIDVVASHLYRGLTAEELAVNFSLDLGQVYAVLAYYYQHKPELDERMRSDIERGRDMLNELEAKGKLIRIEGF